METQLKFNGYEMETKLKPRRLVPQSSLCLSNVIFLSAQEPRGVVPQSSRCLSKVTFLSAQEPRGVVPQSPAAGVGIRFG